LTQYKNIIFDVNRVYSGNDFDSYSSTFEGFIRTNQTCVRLALKCLNVKDCKTDEIYEFVKKELINEGWDPSVFDIPSGHANTSAFKKGMGYILDRLRYDGYALNRKGRVYYILERGRQALINHDISLKSIDLKHRVDNIFNNKGMIDFDELLDEYAMQYGFKPEGSLIQSLEKTYVNRTSRNDTTKMTNKPTVDDEFLPSEGDPDEDEDAYGNDDYEDMNYGYNLIISGVPGCGKSYSIQKRIADMAISDDLVFRTVFHPEYTNSDFIGHYMLDEDEEGNVKYVFEAGPFTEALSAAFSNDCNVALVIEEINRGDSASIFGEIFQLLDRKHGSSEWGISCKPISNHLKRKGIEGDFSKIRIPQNLFIFATMNVSDQNVYPLDTAFTRRWKFERYPNVFDYRDEISRLYVPLSDLLWKDFVERMNDYIVDNKKIHNSEDKQIGTHFVDSSCLCKNRTTVDDVIDDPVMKDVANDFANKVLGYLWSNVSRSCRGDFFIDVHRLDDLIERYMQIGLSIFNSAIGFNGVDGDGQRSCKVDHRENTI